MAYKVIYDLTPIGYFLDFISLDCKLSSLPTATLVFQTHSYPRAFALATSSVWNAISQLST